MGSSRTRDRTRVPCTGRQILYLLLSRQGSPNIPYYWIFCFSSEGGELAVTTSMLLSLLNLCIPETDSVLKFRCGLTFLAVFFICPNQIFFTSKRSEHAQWWKSLIDGGIHLGYFKASSHRKPKKYPLNFSCWSLSWTLFISPKRSLFCAALFFPPLYGPDSICHYLDIEHFLQIKEKVTSGNSQIQAYWRLDDTANH